MPVSTSSMQKRHKVEICGLLSQNPFHIARCCAEDLHRDRPRNFEAPTIRAALEFEWRKLVEAKRRELGGEMWSFVGAVLCFVDGNLIGSCADMVEWARSSYAYTDHRPHHLYSAIAHEEYNSYFLSKGDKRSFAWIEMKRGGVFPVGRLLIELYDELCPAACDNFRKLCRADGTHADADEDATVGYRGTKIHRIVNGGWFQAGDVCGGHGNGGRSTYEGGRCFGDESYVLRHDESGVVGMCNAGSPHTNKSQFYVTFKPNPWMDTKYTAFGKLVEGFDALAKIEQMATGENERPLADVVITGCGVFQPRPPRLTPFETIEKQLEFAVAIHMRRYREAAIKNMIENPPKISPPAEKKEDIKQPVGGAVEEEEEKERFGENSSPPTAEGDAV